MSSRDLRETTMSTTRLYEGRILNLRTDTVTLPDGNEGQREIVEHVPAVTIIPFIRPNKIILIKQWRQATEQVLLEAPAGCMDPGEDPLIAAKRELREETGYDAKNWIKLSAAYMAPGFCDEYMHFYLAEGLTMGATDMDSDEFIDTEEWTIEDLDAKIQNHEINDAKTLLGLLLAKPYIA
ncbi:NUDIX hydrolase [bacterium]|jgi:ADP-ribose pyrophosphatase|nr:NUDIX hydrolase [bacterium]